MSHVSPTGHGTSGRLNFTWVRAPLVYKLLHLQNIRVQYHVDHLGSRKTTRQTGTQCRQPCVTGEGLLAGRKQDLSEDAGTQVLRRGSRPIYLGAQPASSSTGPSPTSGLVCLPVQVLHKCQAS